MNYIMKEMCKLLCFLEIVDIPQSFSGFWTPPSLFRDFGHSPVLWEKIMSSVKKISPKKSLVFTSQPRKLR